MVQEVISLLSYQMLNNSSNITIQIQFSFTITKIRDFEATTLNIHWARYCIAWLKKKSAGLPQLFHGNLGQLLLLAGIGNCRFAMCTAQIAHCSLATRGRERERHYYDMWKIISSQWEEHGKTLVVVYGQDLETKSLIWPIEGGALAFSSS